MPVFVGYSTSAGGACKRGERRGRPSLRGWFWKASAQGALLLLRRCGVELSCMSSISPPGDVTPGGWSDPRCNYAVVGANKCTAVSRPHSSARQPNAHRKHSAPVTHKKQRPKSPCSSTCDRHPRVRPFHGLPRGRECAGLRRSCSLSFFATPSVHPSTCASRGLD